MTQILVALVTFGLPALLAFGSSARRQLGLIREEVKTLDELPPGSEAEKTLRDQIDESVARYKFNSQNRSRFWGRIMAVVGITLTYWGAAFIILFRSGTSLADQFYTTEREEAFGTMVAVAAVVVGLILLMIAQVQVQAARRRK